MVLGTKKCNVCKKKLSIWAFEGSTKYKTCKMCAQEIVLRRAAQPAARPSPAPTYRAPRAGISRSFEADGDAVWKALRGYATGHELKEADLSTGTLLFTTKMSAFSPGEKYTASVSGADGNITVTITGGQKRALYALQPGRIEKISNEALQHVARQVGDEAPPWKKGSS